MFDNLRADMQMYEDAGGWYSQLGFYITATYRFGHWARALDSRAARLGCGAVHRAMAAPWRFFRNVHLPSAAEIGPGLRLIHPHSILVAPGSKIGARCSLYQEVTLGTGPSEGVPSLGDDVMVFAGAKLLGGIEVGDDVHVGANAVVSRSVPPGATAASQPARIIPPRTSEVVRH